MHLMFKQLFIFLMLSILGASVQANISVIDDIGKSVKLSKPAERIISLAPHITESLFSAGAGNKIIGAVSYSDYPEAAKKIPRVGGYPSIDIEQIISLKPDLVIVWSSGNNTNQIEKLVALGLTVFNSDPKAPEDIANTILRFGMLAGTEQASKKASAEFLKHYRYLQNKYSHKEKVKTFYQIWNKPLMTINGHHLISDIINLCGGVNVFTDLKSLTPKISIEAVIATNTDVIIAGGMGKAKPEWMKEWYPWEQIPAVKNKNVFFVEPSLLQRVGPRILQGADQLCALLDEARSKGH